MFDALIAALALAQAAPAAAPQTDYSFAQPTGGTWSYGGLPDGSETRFTGASGQVQVALRCSRPVRRITISKPASAPETSLLVWTTGGSRRLPAPGFDAAAGRLNVQLAAMDPLLDAMIFSRGRIAIAAGAGPALVVPPWPEIARVVEDCRT
jgi:hypothetical protein